MQSIGYNDCDLAWAPTGKEKLFNDRPQQCRTSWRRSSSAHARSAVAVVGEAKDELLQASNFNVVALAMPVKIVAESWKLSC